MELREKLIESTLLYEGKLLKLRCDTVTLPNGTVSVREIIEHPGAVAVVAVTATGQIVLVRQYRHAVGDILLEIPAGKLNPGENPLDCAYRELEEETGFAAGSLRHLASVYTTPGFTNEKIHLFFASELRQTKQNPDEDEFINVELYESVQLQSMIEAGALCDSKTLLGLLLAGVLS